MGPSVLALAAGALLATGTANAQDPDGPSVKLEDGCMQAAYGTPVANSNKLNCTANDIRISRAVTVDPESCIEGETFDLTATFEVNVTANDRYDAGFFFRIDGGPNARGDGTNATGDCSLSVLDPEAGSPVNDEDADSCGDLDAGVKQVTFVIPDVLCAAAPNTNLLKLPNCTSWHSNQGTACTITDPLSSDDLTDLKPDTKAKCVCDDNFTVPVIVEDATIEVTKDPSRDSVPESGGSVTFTVTIKNLAEHVSIIIDTITDTDFGNLGTSSDPDNTCDDLIGDTLGPGATTSCTFTAFLSGDADTQHENTVTVTGHQVGNNNPVSDDDPATVDFDDESAAPQVTKDATAAANCTVEATYQVDVANNSALDTLTINSLNDDKFGDLTTVHLAGGGFEEVVSTTCNQPGNLFPAPIAVQGNYTCEFVGRIVDADCNINHTNEATADVTDDDGVNSTPSDTAAVSGMIQPDP
jgi:hypothetical protein